MTSALKVSLLILANQTDKPDSTAVSMLTHPKELLPLRKTKWCLRAESNH